LGYGKQRSVRDSKQPNQSVHCAEAVNRAPRIYELGPEPAPDDIDGRTPAVVTWHDADLFFLVASDTMSSHELVRIAISLYGRGRINRAAGGS
jgi:hypothetical protein